MTSIFGQVISREYTLENLIKKIIPNILFQLRYIHSKIIPYTQRLDKGSVSEHKRSEHRKIASRWTLDLLSITNDFFRIKLPVFERPSAGLACIRDYCCLDGRIYSLPILEWLNRFAILCTLDSKSRIALSFEPKSSQPKPLLTG